MCNNWSLYFLTGHWPILSWMLRLKNWPNGKLTYSVPYTPAMLTAEAFLADCNIQFNTCIEFTGTYAGFELFSWLWCPTASYPTASMHLAPLPLVSCLILSTGSSLSKFMGSAPNLAVLSSLYGQWSITKTLAAPRKSALITEKYPTGPAPNTATSSPTPTSAISAAKYPVQRASLKKSTCSSLS